MSASLEPGTEAIARRLAASRALLKAERRALLSAVERVPMHDRHRRPAEGCWSVVEVLEHLARVDKGVTRLLVVKGTAEAVAAGDASAPGAELTPEVVNALRNRELRRVAPERVQPTGTSTPEAAMELLLQRRAELLAATEHVHLPALALIAHEHATLGVLNLGSWIEFVAHHEARHAEQVLEVAGMLGHSRA